MTIDTTNLCSHLQRKLFDEDGIYHPIWTAMQDDPELTAVVRSRQMPDRVVASPYVGMKYGSIVMMKIPKPKPVVRCTKLAPILSRNMAITTLLI